MLRPPPGVVNRRRSLQADSSPFAWFDASAAGNVTRPRHAALDRSEARPERMREIACLGNADLDLASRWEWQERDTVLRILSPSFGRSKPCGQRAKHALKL
jgi:hypothetical protein